MDLHKRKERHNDQKVCSGNTRKENIKRDLLRGRYEILDNIWPHTLSSFSALKVIKIQDYCHQEAILETDFSLKKTKLVLKLLTVRYLTKDFFIIAKAYFEVMFVFKTK